MKAKSIVSFILIMVLIAAFAIVCAFDIEIGNFRIPGVLGDDGIKKGLDLVGGSTIVFEPDVEDLSTVSDNDMDSAEAIIRARLDAQGYTEATISRQGDTSIRVEIPNIDDPQAAVDLIGQVAKLQFLDADGNEIMDGSSTYVKKATKMYGYANDSSTQEHYVQLEFTSEGRAKFAEATAAAVALADENKNYISIALDGEIQLSPTVSTVIDDDTCIITGGGGSDVDQATWATNVTNLINSGSLPFALKDAELRSVGPTLGSQALATSLKAALIGVILVMLFMLIFYRLPGLVADISLVAYISVMLLIMAGFFIGDGVESGYRITLTLPGIAGVILSIGMAVDANIVIFERIKDELRQGKSVGAAVDGGFKRAITAVIDSNVTTIIACVVLYIFGSGTIKGFAVTLFIGIVCSMLTAIFLTKLLLKLIVGFGVKNKALYGLNKRRDA